jgi:hypothetical protein
MFTSPGETITPGHTRVEAVANADSEEQSQALQINRPSAPINTSPLVNTPSGDNMVAWISSAESPAVYSQIPEAGEGKAPLQSEGSPV